MARYDLTFDDVARHLANEPTFRTRQVWEGLYAHGVGPTELTTLPKSLRAELAADPAFANALEKTWESTSADGQTVKWLWQLDDGARIETVLMHYPGRSTVCVSSQAGCAMACGFCATGQAGFDRHLRVGEIVEQVVRARATATSSGRRLSNVVFMGMGEPLANFGPVWESVERIHADLGLSARHITVSTVGIVPGIRKIAAASLPVSLAVSLHAANDALRDGLVPINRRYSLDELHDACREYLAAKHRRLSFEWALIDEVNDREQDAEELAAYALPLSAHVNLIPLNPTPGYPTRGTPMARVHQFREALRSRGINATVRQNRGTEIDAACGQLRAEIGHRAD